MQNKPDGKPTFFQSLVAGGAAGTAVDLLFFPIDTIKTRLQSSQGFSAAGGFRGIYKGVGSVVVGSAPGAAAFFSVYDTMKKTLPLTEELAPMNHMISASVGEISACMIRVPTEVIKTRTQTSSYGAAHASSVAAMKIVFRNEGINGFYRGFGITVIREADPIHIPPLHRKPLYAHEAAVCGSIAGGVAAALTTPLDVLKTRVMLDMRNSKVEKLPSLYAHFRNIYTQEGIHALFAGVVPRTLWISAGGAVFLGVYEWTVHGLMDF
ncbi:S-adenosylmethionine transporter [Leucoagaricus gongylophorus]